MTLVASATTQLYRSLCISARVKPHKRSERATGAESRRAKLVLMSMLFVSGALNMNYHDCHHKIAGKVAQQSDNRLVLVADVCYFIDTQLCENDPRIIEYFT